jgi:hypothetical protein
VITTPWNDELIWGYSNAWTTGGEIGDFQELSQLRLPYQQYPGTVYDNPPREFARNWLSASYNVAARYYTTNGLPLEEDADFDVPTMFELTMTPEENNIGKMRGILQPGKTTVNFYMNREPRFYANLMITGGYLRSYFIIFPLDMIAGVENIGGYNPQYPYDYYSSGMGIMKFVHPESQCLHWQRIVRYPYPIVRLADLYLMKAEALNECEGPTKEVMDAINIVRQRAGIPNVEVSWGNAKTKDKHTTKEGMRDIILRERGIELAFEGHRFWDMWRHLRCEDEFNSPIMIWNAMTGTTPETFFMLVPNQVRQFATRDYLWPIDLNEMNTNGNLKQNPNWQ